MRLSVQFLASLFIYLFLRKDFERTKTQINQNQPTKTKISEERQRFFALTKASKKVEIVCFRFWCFLYAQTLLVTKKWLEIALIASFTILLSQKLTSYFC